MLEAATASKLRVDVPGAVAGADETSMHRLGSIRVRIADVVQPVAQILLDRDLLQQQTIAG